MGVIILYICPKKLANYLLCTSNICLPINKNHYVTGRDLSYFSSLACIEQTLSNLTCNIKGICSSFNKNYFR